MKKLRNIIVITISIIYLLLFLMKVEIPRSVFITILSIILINNTINEWQIYKETKDKIHLLIPITFLVFIIILMILVI